MRETRQNDSAREGRKGRDRDDGLPGDMVGQRPHKVGRGGAERQGRDDGAERRSPSPPEPRRDELQGRRIDAGQGDAGHEAGEEQEPDRGRDEQAAVGDRRREAADPHELS